MLMNKEELIKACRKLGVDEVGICPIERFNGVEPSGDPRYVLPSVKSVIVLLHSIPRGWTRGTENHSEWATTYTRGGHLDSSITMEIAYNVCSYIEDCNFDAVPIYNYPLEMRGQGVQVKSGRPAPDVIPDAYFAAHAAGLGQFGKCGLFLTPKYGPRQQFTVILTNAEIEPDPIITMNICDDCGECAKACHKKAIDTEKFEYIKQTNGDIEIYKIQKEYCASCRSGVLPNSFWSSAEGDRTLAACGRACIAHLEDKGILEYQFVNNYRREK